MAVVALQTRTERLWQAYVAAKLKADKTLALADGLAAARAWRAWLDDFMGGDQ